jgi:hypothetical protein
MNDRYEGVERAECTRIFGLLLTYGMKSSLSSVSHDDHQRKTESGERNIDVEMIMLFMLEVAIVS